MATEVKIRWSKHLQLENASGECQRLFDFIAQNLEKLSVSSDFIHDLKLVAEELLVNIVSHGYDDDMQATVDVELAVDAHNVIMTFTDSGRAFNPLERAASEKPDDLSLGGMGIQLVVALTDNQDYKRENGTNVFTVTKHYNN